MDWSRDFKIRDSGRQKVLELHRDVSIRSLPKQLLATLLKMYLATQSKMVQHGDVRAQALGVTDVLALDIPESLFVHILPILGRDGRKGLPREVVVRTEFGLHFRKVINTSLP